MGLRIPLSALLVMGLVFALVAPVHAATLTVTTAPDTDCTDVLNECDLPSALAYASGNLENDVLNLQAGTYSSSSAFAYSSDENYSLTLAGQGPGDTVLTGQGTHQVLSIRAIADSLADISISGITIRDGSSASLSGGGLYVNTHLGDVIVEDCEFIDNVTAENRGSGGGAWLSMTEFGNGAARISNCSFTGNEAVYGGGLYVGYSHITLQNNTFDANVLTGPIMGTDEGGGGGAWVVSRDGIVSVAGNSFTGNGTSTVDNCRGGGLGLNIQSIETTTLENNTFDQNEVADGGSGGGLYIYKISGPIQVVGNVFVSNSVGVPIDGFGGGGGLFIATMSSGSDVTVVNNVVVNNSGGSAGGALFDVTEGIPTLTNNTFATNASGNSVGVELDLGFWGGNIYNNIFWDHILDLWLRDPYSMGPTVDLFNNVIGRVNMDATVSTVGASGNLMDTDPLIDTSVIPTDYHLPSNSPAIDAGDDSAPGLSLVLTDVDGVDARILDGDGAGGAVVDIGADEHPTAGPCVPVEEVCDGVDNDCDGSVDEDLTQPTTCGVGACEGNTGEETCSAGEWVNDTCDPYFGAASDDAVCDGIDSDCDGSTDEDFSSSATNCGVGACESTGTLQCILGSEVDSCTPGTPAADDTTCDGVDDDCDGTSDEDFSPSASSCGLGECASTGSLTCESGSLIDTCAPGSPVVEVCNGLDDDCDGALDNDPADGNTFYEDNDGDTFGTLSMTELTCSETPSPGYTTDSTDCDDKSEAVYPGATEVCDNAVDDDCDGYTDCNDTEDCAADPSCAQSPCWETFEVDEGAFSVDIAVDSTDNIHMCYFADNPSGPGGVLRYATGDPDLNMDAWTIENVTAPNLYIESGAECSITAGSDGSVHIAYVLNNLTRLLYTRRETLGWQGEVVEESGVVGECDLALDQDNVPHISYRKDNGPLIEVKHASRPVLAPGFITDTVFGTLEGVNTGRWNSITCPDKGDDYGGHVSFFDDAGNSWNKVTHHQHPAVYRYQEALSLWQSVPAEWDPIELNLPFGVGIISAEQTNFGYNNKVFIDNSGTIRLASYEHSVWSDTDPPVKYRQNNLVYSALDLGQEQWRSLVVDSFAANDEIIHPETLGLGMAMEDNGNFHLAFRDITSRTLKYVTGYNDYNPYSLWEQRKYHTETVDAWSGLGTGTAIAVDTGGTPYIAYLNSVGKLNLAKRVSCGDEALAISPSRWNFRVSQLYVELELNQPEIEYVRGFPFRIYNIGDQTLAITNITVSGDGFGFSGECNYPEDCIYPGDISAENKMTLEPGGYYEFEVRYFTSKQEVSRGKIIVRSGEASVVADLWGKNYGSSSGGGCCSLSEVENQPIQNGAGLALASLAGLLWWRRRRIG